MKKQTNQLEIISPSADQTFLPSDTVLLSARYSGMPISISSGRFSVDGELTTLMYPHDPNWFTFRLSGLNEGRHEVFAIFYGVQNIELVRSAVVTFNVKANPTGIVLTSPLDDSEFTAPATVPLRAELTEALRGRAVTAVRFIDGNNNSIGEDMTAPPYEYNWSRPNTGSYSVKAVAILDQGGALESAMVDFLVKKADPTGIVLTSPSNNSEFTAPASVLLRAELTEALSGRSVMAVRFIDGNNNRIGDDMMAPPYEYTWSRPNTGSYSVKAVAVLEQGPLLESAVASFRVEPVLAVSIVSPKNDDEFVFGESITVEAEASGPRGIARVEFYRNGVRFDTDYESPYSVTMTASTQEERILFIARAFDNRGGILNSSPIGIRVKRADPTGIVLTSPLNDSEFTAPASVLLRAELTEALNGRAVTAVRFIDGDNNRIGDDMMAPPYEYTWSRPNPGPYSVKAVATLDQGGPLESAMVDFLVRTDVDVTEIVLSSPRDRQVFEGVPYAVPLEVTLIGGTRGVRFVKFKDATNGDTIEDVYTPEPDGTYRHLWSRGAGLYHVEAVALLTDGGRLDSNPVSFEVKEAFPTGIDLSSPQEGQVFQGSLPYAVPLEVTLTGGTQGVSFVKFKDARNGATIADVSSPESDGTYRHLWSCEAGSYDVEAVAVLTSGRLDAGPVNFRVVSNSTWPSKGVHIGNSITRHGITSFWWGLWGMAASERSKDYVHQLESLIKAKNPVYSGSVQEPQGWETNHVGFDYRVFNAVLPLDIDFVTLVLGDNTQDTTGFANSCFEFLTYIRNRLPSATIICTDNWYNNQIKADAWKSAASRVPNVKFVPIGDIRNSQTEAGMGTLVWGDDGQQHVINDSGVATHPGDLGMQAIAARLFENIA